jgi:hypothetical protein
VKPFAHHTSHELTSQIYKDIIEPITKKEINQIKRAI